MKNKYSIQTEKMPFGADSLKWEYRGISLRAIENSEFEVWYYCAGRKNNTLIMVYKNYTEATRAIDSFLKFTLEVSYA